MTVTQQKLETIAAAVQTVETLANAAVVAGVAAPNAQQKLGAAIAIAIAVDPTLAPQATLIQTIIGSLVGVFNAFGLFKKKAVSVAPVGTASSTNAP